VTQRDELKFELQRSSTAELIAERLRSLIMEGALQPGAKISEGDFTQALRVSRNTLREAFRLLAHERLLVHQLNQGVFVRRLDASDVVDLFAVRRVVECAAIRADRLSPDAAARLDAIVTEAEHAAAGGRWGDVGTGNMLYHQAVAGLLGSRRVDELMRQVLAELRLVFHVMSDLRRFHEAYLPRNRAILDTLIAGDPARAERMLHEYLLDAERQLLDAYRSPG
jgi:DNA-binding GntR family transcriptional regulator